MKKEKRWQVRGKNVSFDEIQKFKLLDMVNTGKIMGFSRQRRVCPRSIAKVRRERGRRPISRRLQETKVGGKS